LSEARRLANENPGKRFLVMQSVKTVRKVMA